MGGELSIGTLKGTITLADQFSGPIEKVGKALGISAESFKAVTAFAGLAVSGIAAATGAIVALGVRGSNVNDVRQAFDGLTAGVGSTAEAMLGALQQGTLGTISNFDLMKAANSALGTGLIKSSSDMETLASGAKLLADRTGGDTAQAFETLTSAMATGRTGSLKQLSLFVDTKAAVETYAASIGKLPKDLSQHEEATARSQAALAALKAELTAAGTPTRDFSDLMNIAKVGVQNFTDNLGAAIAASPVVMAGFAGIEEALSGAFGGNQQDKIKFLMGYVNQFAIGVVKAAEVAVEGARYITYAWDGVKAAFNAVVGFQLDVIGKLITSFGSLVEAATHIPGIGEKFTGLASSVKAIGADVEHLATGFYAQAKAAVDSAADSKAAFDSTQEALQGIEASMRAAASAEVEIKTNSPAPVLRDVAEAASLTAAQMQAMEDATRKGIEALMDLAAQGADRFKELQDRMTLDNLTGSEARLFEVQLAYEKELAALQAFAFSNPPLYDELVAMVQAHYQQMSDAALGHFASVEQAAAAAGFATRDEMQRTADNAAELYDAMLASGKFTYKELQKAKQKATDAAKALDGEEELSAVQKFELIASSASGILRSIFGKSKAMAIAAAVIDTAAAVVKTLAAYPWPWSLIPAAAALAAGIAQVHKIESVDASFKMGTPDTAFMDFGRERAITVHGPEAILNRAQGESVRDMVADALQTERGEIVAELKRQRDEARQRDRGLVIALRDAVLLATA